MRVLLRFLQNLPSRNVALMSIVDGTIDVMMLLDVTGRAAGPRPVRMPGDIRKPVRQIESI